jgi:hypothetical protein
MLFTVKYSNLSTFTMVHVVAIFFYTNLYRCVHVVSANDFRIYDYASLLSTNKSRKTASIIFPEPM